MTNEKSRKLKEFLEAEGFTEEEYGGLSYTVDGDGGNSLVFSVKVQLPYAELPEQLAPFAHGEVERAMEKGNTKKQTWNGADFELALRNYANFLLGKEPEVIALEASVPLMKDMAEFREYQRKLQVVWDRICNLPEVVELQRQLDELY